MRRYLWALDLLAVALVAIFLGRAAASGVAARLDPLRPRHEGRSSSPATMTRTGPAKDPAAIADRNVFCSTCPPSRPDPDPPPTREPGRRRTTLPLQLLAVNFAPPPWGARYTSAVVRHNESRTVGSFGLGQGVSGAVITAIHETRVDLDHAGQAEYLDLLEPPLEDASQEQVRALAAPRDPLAQALERIKQRSDDAYEIPRESLDAVLGNTAALVQAARIVPDVRDGRAAGMRLFAVRPQGPFDRIGLRSGDVLVTINGLELTSVEKAFEVYAKLKSASHLQLGLERDGKRLTKDYTIR